MKTFAAVLCLVFVAVCNCQDDGAYAPVEGEEYDTVKKEQALKKEAPKEAPKGTFSFEGQYKGQCNSSSFVYK